MTNEKETSAVLTGLLTGNKYNVSVFALRGNELGMAATKTFTTALPPPRLLFDKSGFCISLIKISKTISKHV